MSVKVEKLDHSIRSSTAPAHLGHTDLLPTIGDASSAIFLLRDYSRFGLPERICYHFDLAEALTTTNLPISQTETKSTESKTEGSKDLSSASEKETNNDGNELDDSPTPTCGILQVLELAPGAVSHRLSKRQKRFLRMRVREFNAAAEKVHHERSTICYQPQDLPLRCNPSTKVSFGYEKTRIAFCVDASASLTSTFGVNGSRPSGSKDNVFCPLDRLPEMARIFFASLIEPIGNTSTSKSWTPLISVTVLAVFPMGKISETNLLVRDFLVHDAESAKELIDRIERWTYSEVESGISERLSRRQVASTWSIPIYSSNLKHILEAGDYALDVLSSDARPVIVVATDGRSISCDGIVDVFLDADRVDIPIHVLDLSLHETHTMEDDRSVSANRETNFLTYDPGGIMGFPLYLTDDSEALFVVCRATGGCFLDLSLLSETAKSTAGQQQTTDELVAQSYTFRRRFVKMNGLQWLVLFSLSPICPTFHSSWGKLIPPQYLQKQLNKSMMEVVASANESADLFRHQGGVRQVVVNEQFQRNASDKTVTPSSRRKHIQAQTTFSTYVVSPVRIKALILTRVKEGYRAKKYGLNTRDPDKVLIQFTLPLESGTILHYELSYKALSSENYLVGSAHIKIELSGDPRFIQAVKNNFLHQSLQKQEQHSRTIREKRMERLCEVMKGIRRGDLLQSYLRPPQNWDNILSSSDSPFVKRLRTLESIERKRHFQGDQFDVVCSGAIPDGLDDLFLSGFMTNQDGKQELIDAITNWSTQTVTNGSMFLKKCSNSGQMTNYCLVEIKESTRASKLFTIFVEFFGGTDPIKRFETMHSLKETLGGLTNVDVLGKQIAPFLIGNKDSLLKDNVQIQFHHATWDLVKDPELLSLLSKRRTEIGGFRLLESRDDYALFAKLAPKTSDSPGDLMQYEIAVNNDNVVIDLHMESESGVFNPYSTGARKRSQFSKMVNIIRRRDQECGRALKSRTTLLHVVNAQGDNEATGDEHQQCVKRLLAYSSRVTRSLPYFRNFGDVNDILVELTSELLLSRKFGVRSARLQIDPDILIGDEQAGVWFIIQYDRQTMSVLHLSLVDSIKNSEKIQTFRELTFFTIGISDLYSKRDDLADDDSAESHISEYLCVSDFADRFEVEQVKNFTLAAYLALREPSEPSDGEIDTNDFKEVIQSLQFVEVNKFLVTGAPRDDDADESKLLRALKTILSPIPGDPYHFYYSGSSSFEGLEVDENESGDTSDDDSSNASEGFKRTEGLPQKVGDLILTKGSDSANDINDDESSKEDSENPHESFDPPIFVRFHLDGKIASSGDLNQIVKSSMLTVTVSVFKSDNNRINSSLSSYPLPLSHQGFAAEIATLLKSYIAERTLERLRSATYFEDNLQLVRRCVARIRSVVSFVMEIYFFISQRDMMMPAAAPAGGEAEVEEGLLALEMELTSNRHFVLKPLPDGVYFVSGIVGEEVSLQFWCLLKLQRSDGTISSQIYHPAGETVGMYELSRIHDILCSCINIVNQQLLLRSMHRTRTASELLIPNLSLQKETKNTVTAKFLPGVFKCPIVFRKLFGLYHRAATNPGQVARTLEATVLHNFAVSNRPGIFVYKDETGAIFYMKIEPRGSGIDSDGQVELLVYGIRKPGPSVTEQLSVLLQRRLLLIGADMLSSVLTKNPHFKWKPADFQFLRSFDSEWREIVNEDTDEKNRCYYFKFPEGVYDPCMVSLFFRQNLCGSTFFHRLNDISQDGSTPSPSICVSGMLASGGTRLRMNSHDFSVYYNNAPSKLDPAFQGFNTLTEKGADYCRKTGQGIAIVEFTLVNGKNDSADELRFAEPPSPTFSVSELPHSQARMQCFDEIPSDASDDSIFVRIHVTDTALNRDILKEWLLLSFNQALVGWTSERLFERSYLGVLRPGISPVVDKHNVKQDNLVDTLCPGLVTFKNTFESSHDLPHPCIMRFESSGVLRSSSVANLTLDFLENHILGPLVENKMINIENEDGPKRLISERLMKNLKIIRLSRSEKPCIARIKWEENGRKNAVVSVVSKSGALRKVEDSPVDCPEYICFFALAERDSHIKSIDTQLRLYREVVIHDGISEKSESIKVLQSIKKQIPEAFFRSFAFIFSVKRNARRLWTYNWSPKLVKSLQIKFNEVDAMNRTSNSRVSHLLQRRSLGNLSPGFVDTANKKRIQQPLRNSDTKVTQDKDKNSEIKPSQNLPNRRIRRPTMIRRPKLIGKSVEGAAMQAVAASRKRASTNQFKNKTSSTTGTAITQLNKDRTRARATMARKTESTMTRSQSTVKRTIQEEKKDENWVRVVKDFLSLSSNSPGQKARLNSTQSKARLKLTDIWWPSCTSQIIPKSIIEFLVLLAPNAWNNVCALPPLPGGVSDMFIPTFARWIVAIKPGLEILSVSSSPNEASKRVDSILLRSEIRKVRGTKCFAVSRITIIDSTKTRQRRPIVRSEGWILNLRRRAASSKRKRRRDSTISSYLTEKDSAGMDKVLSDIFNSLILESLLFDFSASMVERAVRLLDRRIKFEDLVPTVQVLMKRCPYQSQKRMPYLNYRAFEATIVLKSYNDRLINMFETETLFERLCIEAQDRETLSCTNALSLKPISIKGSQSLFFITLYPNESGKMKLVILTRTQGLDLADFMFREGCNVAIHILDNIAIEGSRLALKELHFVAECLLKDTLWKSFSSSSRFLTTALKPTSSKMPQQQSLRELLRLVPTQPFLQLPMSGSSKIDRIPDEVSFLFGKESGIDWLSCCSSMKQNKFFSPHTSTENKGSINNLFYVRRYDIFLMIVVKRDGSLLSIDVIEKKRTPDKYNLIFDSVLSFVLQYVWRNL